MYEKHFGLKELPFNLTPDTDFYFSYADHQEALNVLLVALGMGEGFLKITGEVGTGKTLVCRKLLNALADQGVVTAYIPNPFLTPSALRHSLAEELGVSCPRNTGGDRVLQLIYHRLIELKSTGHRVVVLLDEAQALPRETLEAIRLLTNLETEKSKLLQVVLFGQPELDTLLAQQSVRQLRQRITFSHSLRPMSLEGCRGYVGHRLRVAGGDTALFEQKAIQRLYRGSRGIPRLINILAHKALMAGYGEGRERVARLHVDRAIRDTEEARLPPGPFARFWRALSGRHNAAVLRGGS